MKKDNPTFILYALAIWIIIMLAVIFSGCSGEKAVQRKDDKAVARVLADDDLMARVGKRMAPCVNDTTTVSDTVEMLDIDVVYDTAYTYRNDTIVSVITKTRVKQQTRTQVKYVADTRAALQWRDSADKYRTLYIQGQSAPKKKEGWPWWVWLSIGAIGGAGGAALALRKVLPIAVIIRAITMLVSAFKKKAK